LDQPFKGQFDGDGYIISGLKINRPKKTAQGLFAFIGEEGEVRNIGLTENSICGLEGVGAIAGINFGTIEACFQDGEVYGVEDSAGSIAGKNSGTISNCYSTGTACGGYRTGDYIPETAGEEKGRNAGRGGFRDFIMTIAETIAETVSETLSYVLEETKAGLETLYEIVTTTLSPEEESPLPSTSQETEGIGDDSQADVGNDDNLQSSSENVGDSPSDTDTNNNSKEDHTDNSDPMPDEEVNSNPEASHENDTNPDSDASQTTQPTSIASGDEIDQPTQDNDSEPEMNISDVVPLEAPSTIPALGGLAGRNEGGVVENSYQAGRQAAKSTDWTVGGITGTNIDGLIDNCYYVQQSAVIAQTAKEEFDGVSAITITVLTGENAAEQLGLSFEFWTGQPTEEDRQDGNPEEMEDIGSGLIQYRHYYPQLTIFAERGQPCPYTLGYFEADGLRIDTLSKKAYVSTTEAWRYLFTGTEYLDYEILLEADLDLSSFEPSIGTMEDPFTGILDGNGHVITGLKHPLFGVLGDGSAVYYLLLDQAEIRQMAAHGADEYSTGAYGCGVLAAYSRNAVIDSCGAVGMISLVAQNVSDRPVYLGGLIGEAGGGDQHL